MNRMDRGGLYPHGILLKVGAYGEQPACFHLHPIHSCALKRDLIFPGIDLERNMHSLLHCGLIL
jgi:hypothetical protein